MISEVDDVLRALILKDLSVRKSSVDIKYNQPNREWSSRLSKPTINIFLFDIRENLRLRASEQYFTLDLGDGTMEVRRNAVRVDLRYLVTAWTKEPEDEHLLLSDALMCLLRHPFLPPEMLKDELKRQPVPIPLEAAVFQPEHGPMDKISELWSVLNNEIRAGFVVTVTLSVDPYKPEIFPRASVFEKRLGQREAGEAALSSASAPETFDVVFRLKSEKYALSALSAVLQEKNLPLETSDQGEVVLRHAPAGVWHIDVLYNGKVVKRQAVKIPGTELEIIV